MDLSGLFSPSFFLAINIAITIAIFMQTIVMEYSFFCGRPEGYNVLRVVEGSSFVAGPKDTMSFVIVMECCFLVADPKDTMSFRTEGEISYPSKLLLSE